MRMISGKEQMKKGGKGKRIKQQNSVINQTATVPHSPPSHAHTACSCSRLILDSTAISGLTTILVLIGVVAPSLPSLAPTAGTCLGLSLCSTAILELTTVLVLIGAELHLLG